MEEYNHRKIEKKWQKEWEKKDFYRAKDFDKRPKKYIMIEFPYPSGDGLHVGHARSYSALDAVARKKRMEGYNVLYPIGWDAFGLPTENYAIKKGVHPSIVTKKNIAKFKKQLKSLGFSFDWSREINTTDPEYYKWTQWIFLQFFKEGLAYRAEMPINWCPSCKIGLANEEVVDGKCERCGAETRKRKIKQWMLKITAYADRLLEDLKTVDYLEKIRIQQENWIGRSEGTEVKFPIVNSQFSINVFTTRADTLFGVTALVVAPEHEIISNLKSQISNLNEVENYIKECAKRSELERTKEEREKKTGVRLEGISVINPANREEVPVFAGDYVISTYGGGAVMFVPAHDKRDYSFAKKYGLEIREVIQNSKIKSQNDNLKLKILEEAYVDDGILVNSGQFSGLTSERARKEISKWLKEKGAGKKVVQYKLRDWIFSRQHYWGEPIPLVFCGNCRKKLMEIPNSKFQISKQIKNSKFKIKNFNKGELLNPGWIAVSEEELPIKLPYVKKYKPTDTGESPLAGIKTWVNVKCPKCSGPAQRETDTMPNWAGSSWYHLAYIMRGNSKFKIQNSKLFKYWLPVDLYNGGMEHTTLHLLYSRFWHKFLYDLKLVSVPEPYASRRSHGMVLAEDGRKMSKSFGNVINPDEVVEKFGVDALRVYEMFMGPFDQAISWSTQGLTGCYRFLNRVYKLRFKTPAFAKASADKQNFKIERLLHRTIKKVSEDLENMKFNTAISQLMIFANALEKEKEIPAVCYSNFLILLSPFAPHLCQELWSLAGNEEFVSLAKWPEFDLNELKEDKIDLIVQVDGKFRGRINVPAGVSQREAEKLVSEDNRLAKFIKIGVKKVVFVNGRLINFVLNINP